MVDLVAAAVEITMVLVALLHLQDKAMLVVVD
jgi:hypothetical protein